jgi:hypothetical protein
MPKKSRALGRRPLWLITTFQNNRMDPLTIDPGGAGESLAVFSFKEEAETFLRLWEEDVQKRGWRSRQTTVGELISVLLGPCAQVKQVALDPLPLLFNTTLLPFERVRREPFVQELLGERGALVRGLAPSTS